MSLTSHSSSLLLNIFITDVDVSKERQRNKSFILKHLYQFDIFRMGVAQCSMPKLRDVLAYHIT